LARNPRPAAGDIENAYRSDTYGGEKLHALFEAQLPEAVKQAQWLRPYLRRGSRVVEVGSFVGCFLEAASNMGWQAEGVDPGDEVTEFCRMRGLKVHKGALDEDAIPPNSIDGIVVWNTFDQLPDPQCLLAAAKALMRPSGIIAVRVPNGDAFRWWLRLEENGPRSVRDIAHTMLAWNNLLAFPYLYGYGVDSMDQMMAGYGFRRIRASGDTLCRLSDADTRRWAAVEEWGFKRLAIAAGRVENLRPRNPLHVPPWLNLCYRNRPGYI
jgi:SAM-dependent methyltransferase